MSLKREELENHCQTILASRRIKNKLVILCEGEIEQFKETRSPHHYRLMERVPDANFYIKCVPQWWIKTNTPRPQFFTCGDRKDVIDTYFKLLELHDRDPRQSYLNPEQLFALVDLDIPIQKIKDDEYSFTEKEKQYRDNYLFSDTETIYHNLYQNAKLNQTNAVKHRIWVTGLIYKEAYFLLPELQSFLIDFTENYTKFTPHYRDKILDLDDLYRDMANTIVGDEGIKTGLKTIRDRIKFCSKLDCTEVQKLQDSWLTEFDTITDNLEKRELIIALLTFKKIKSYWQAIKPPTDYKYPDQIYREQLASELAQEFYAKRSQDDENHISLFFKTLYQRAIA